LQLLEHPDLAVRLEPRQHPGGVVIVEQLAAELQIQLAAELGDALFDLLGLGGEVFLIVKTDGRHKDSPFLSGCSKSGDSISHPAPFWKWRTRAFLSLPASCRRTAPMVQSAENLQGG